MFTKGEYQNKTDSFGVFIEHSKSAAEVALVKGGTICSAYKVESNGDEYSFLNKNARDLWKIVQAGISGCKSKNSTPMPFQLGTSVMHEYTKSKNEYCIELFNGALVGCDIVTSLGDTVKMEYVGQQSTIPQNIPYIKLTTVKKQDINDEIEDADEVVVRTVEEIALEKTDLTWLKKKKYYIVNDDEQAEKLFAFLDNYKGAIAYDTETTGLKINCFGKINSSYQRQLIEYNNAHPEEPLRADRLVGIIFSVEDNVAYYFPCWNRKFKNLYDTDTPTRRQVIERIKARYTIGDRATLTNEESDMADFIRKTPAEQWGSDVILMERVRDILEKGHIVAHNGSFEWKVGWAYEVDTNLKDDTMIMHQIMYKFRSTTSNRGEPSNLKFLSKVELGIDQWELSDFFPDFKEDNSGTVRSGGKTRAPKKKGRKIDFSYMTYEGTRIYAPTDGDATLLLYKKYKADMLKNHKEQEYIYSVEVIVSCAIAYMEFYGLRINEKKITAVRDQTKAQIQCIVSEIRQSVDYSGPAEMEAYNNLKESMAEFKRIDKEGTEEERDRANENTLTATAALVSAIEADTEHQLNLASPAQVAELFYDVIGIPMQGEKRSVAKRELKGMMKMKNEDGTAKYPVVKMYSDYKKLDTLMTKFFDNLPYYMYPGGLIFCSFGQISTATGRMSCIEENTPIRLVGGEKPIKDVKVGDLVYCYDDDGNVKIKKVLNVIDNGYKDCIRLTWRSQGTGELGELICTPDHKIRLTNGTWIEASDAVGKAISGLSSDNECNTVSIVSIEGVGNNHVYDLEVEDCHNFIANEICVHNCSKPNAQQFPKDITKIVEPRPGYVMMDADYSQIEYRVLTGMAGNDWLAEMFSDPDSDYHTLMASLMYGVPYASVTPKMRSDAKSFNFGIPYGMGFASLAILLTGMSGPAQIDEAKEKYEKYFENQPKTRKFFDTVKEQAQINGYTRTFWNRYRHYSFVDANGNVNNAKKAAALRQAGNAVIQGCAHGMTKIQTREFGIVQLQDVVDKRLLVWDGIKWTFGDILYSGKKRKCIVKFSTGQEFICSPTHKFLVRSHRGTERFVECQDLLTKETSKNPHRVVVNPEYESSDYKYSSSLARIKYTNFESNAAKNIFLDDAGDSFKIGVILGRLASDGNIVNTGTIASLRQIVAEHEKDVMDVLKDYMEPYGLTFSDVGLRENRNEEIYVIKAHSRSLVSEVADLDVKHQVHKNIFMDTELLRGFLRGMFDGDGGVSGKTITLVFGTQCDFEPMCRDIQKALLFFGIRARYYKYDYRYKITIETYDNQRFLDLIGFINEEKNKKARELKTVKDGHIFGRCLTVESVEITDEYIDMYDVCNTDGGYYVADGIITHNTAADIFKISVARNFIYIRKNKLLGHLLIINMVHDEQLFEVNVQKLNMQRILRDVGHNMQFKVAGFPPFYVGAGIGSAWGTAKGKMAEIHPHLLDQLSAEADNLPIFHDKQEPTDIAEVLNYFDGRVYEFRRKMVYDYIINPENYGKDLHPAIGNLLNLQFSYGHDKDKEGLKDDEFTMLCVEEFIKHNNIEGVDVSCFKAQEIAEEPEEEEEDYDDDPDGDPEDIEESMNQQYQLIDESDVIYGTALHDVIKAFKYVEMPSRRMLGLDVTDMYYRNRESMIDYLTAHVCDEYEDGAMEVLLMGASNVINRTGLFVNNIKEDEIKSCMGIK